MIVFDVPISLLKLVVVSRGLKKKKSILIALVMKKFT